MPPPLNRQINTHKCYGQQNNPSASALGKILKWKKSQFLSIASSQRNVKQCVSLAVPEQTTDQTPKWHDKTTAVKTPFCYGDDGTATYGVRNTEHILNGKSEGCPLQVCVCCGMQLYSGSRQTKGEGRVFWTRAGQAAAWGIILSCPCCCCPHMIWRI